MSASASASSWRGPLRLIGHRVLLALITLLLVSAVIFTISGLLPGDAAQEVLGQSATPEQIAALRKEMGLDQPGPVRYYQWLRGISMGDPGQSMVTNTPVSEIISVRLPNTLILAALSTLVSVPFAFLIGIASAIARGKKLDRSLNVLTLSMVALPEFLVATVAVLILSVKLQWLPSITLIPQEASFADYVRGYAMPVMVLAVGVIAQLGRMIRAAIIAELDRPYVEMARLKGVSQTRLVFHHILPNAIGPIVNAMALSLSYLFGGAIIVETIFSYPGLAGLMVNAVTSRDMPLLQACAMIFCAVYLLLVLVADVFAILANPRLRNA
ncbi:ABC transporter permease [Novosphingobium aquimarinum]|uniref:ABC transporter permease n=1 Tax=Novosphingobium aquimarinum TaxID=2682494 RepID=UPI0012EBC9C2|nr:ABC transporter permease [Novosphingobium aquimarinum]